MVELIELRGEEALVDVPDPRVDVAAEALARVTAIEVRRHLTALPHPEQEAVAWSFGLNGHGGRELSSREIGELLGVSKPTAWRLCQRGLALLRVAYGLGDERGRGQCEV